MFSGSEWDQSQLIQVILEIDALLAANITPCVTIYHFDRPQALEDHYGGFPAVNEQAIVDDFVSFAQLLFERFGNRGQELDHHQ